VAKAVSGKKQRGSAATIYGGAGESISITPACCGQINISQVIYILYLSQRV